MLQRVENVGIFLQCLKRGHPVANTLADTNTDIHKFYEALCVQGAQKTEAIV